MKAIITKFNDLRKRVRIPYVPAVWLGFVFWIIALGALVLSLPAWVLYVALAVCFLDKLMMTFQFYGAVAAAKMYNYTLQAVIKTQMLVEEKERLEHKKMHETEEE